ncbi:MAG: serine/threonine-protein kinase [Kofleriaceae bacterium]
MAGDDPGELLPTRFALIRELGEGGMGTVYEAEDRAINRRVAVKVFHDRAPATIDRIKREFRIAAAVRHPSLVRLGELFEHAGSLCFSMALVEGEDLAAWVVGARRVERARIALRQLAGALGALHRAGVIHRDVKPSNVKVTAAGEVVLLDLGLAVPVDSARPELAGTVEYVAPEQVRGEPLTTAADLYSLGVTVFELLTGRAPFEGAPLEILVGKTERDAPPPSTLVHDLPTDLDRLVAALLARAPAARPTARELELSLGEPTAPAPRPRRITGRVRRKLFGRDAEVASLLAACDDPVGAAQTTLFLVRGPAGIGKTAILETFAAAAAARGHLVAFGRCGPREHLRYNAWDALVDTLARHLEGLAAAERAALVPPGAEALSRMFPSFERAVDVTSLSSDAVGALEDDAIAALRELLRRLAATRRIVSILDDAQWATAASFALLEQALAGPSPPCVVVFCVRTANVLPADAQARLARLRELPVRLRLVDIAPLAEADAIALATHLTGDPSVGRHVGAAARGNPMFVELLAGDPEAGTTELPTLMARRVGGLVGDHARVVRALAVAARATRQDVVGAALDMGHDTLAAVLDHLVERGLVRLAGVTRGDTCELVHDVVGDAVLATLDAPTVAALHRRLAAALEALAVRDPTRICAHWAAGGDRERAAATAIAMVTAARDGLAMRRAAAACALVLAQAPPQHPARLMRAQAAALAYAGDGEQAAHLYRAAAATTTGPEQLDLRRLAAELFLRAGQLDEGLALARQAADQVGFDLGLSHPRVLAKISLERMRNRWRGAALAPTSNLDEARQADVCTSLSTGLSMIDTIRAAWFTSRGVRHALDSGSPARAARALALEAILLAARRSGTERKAKDTLAQARSFAAYADEPELLAMVEVAAAGMAMLRGDYPAALAHGDRAVARFRTGVAGIAYERHACEFFTLVACYWLGDWAALGRRKRALLKAADATGDRFARLCATTGVSVIADLLDGVEPAALHAELAASAQAWPRERAPSVYLRQLVAATLIDLYTARPAAAIARLDEAWPFLTKSRVMSTEQARASLVCLRASALVQVGSRAEASADARWLRTLPEMVAAAALVEAALAHARGADPRPLLAEAEAAAERHSLQAYLAAAQDRQGRVMGGDHGADLRLRAADLASRLGLGDPTRAFALLAPWPT